MVAKIGTGFRNRLVRVDEPFSPHPFRQQSGVRTNICPNINHAITWLYKVPTSESIRLRLNVGQHTHLVGTLQEVRNNRTQKTA